MMDSNMSVNKPPRLARGGIIKAYEFFYIPLKIVWSGIFMLLIRAERTDVARRVMH